MNEVVKKNGINYGIILGVISILITASIYSIDLKLFTNMWLGISSMVVFLVIGVILVSKTKKELKGFITFKEAFTVYFLAGAIGATMSVLFNILLFNVIDPEAKEIVNTHMMEYTVEMLKKFNTPTESITKTVEEMKKTDNYSVTNLLKGLVFSFIFSAIVGAILALIFRNKHSNLE